MKHGLLTIAISHSPRFVYCQIGSSRGGWSFYDPQPVDEIDIGEVFSDATY